jgi:hypothetical protein
MTRSRTHASAAAVRRGRTVACRQVGPTIATGTSRGHDGGDSATAGQPVAARHPALWAEGNKRTPAVTSQVPSTCGVDFRSRRRTQVQDKCSHTAVHVRLTRLVCSRIGPSACFAMHRSRHRLQGGHGGGDGGGGWGNAMYCPTRGSVGRRHDEGRRDDAPRGARQRGKYIGRSP